MAEISCAFDMRPGASQGAVFDLESCEPCADCDGAVGVWPWRYRLICHLCLILAWQRDLIEPWERNYAPSAWFARLIESED